MLADRLDEVLRDPAMAEVAYWRAKPPLQATFAYSLKPMLSTAEREKVSRLKKGDFSPHKLFKWRPLGVPPPWDTNPFDSRTFDFYRHALVWTEPLVDAWVCERDVESLSLLKRVIEDWVRNNFKPPGASRYAWRDHATSYRLRLMCWMWEILRRDESFDFEFGRLLLATIYQHALYAADARNYHPQSNHALHLDGSLLAAAVTFPEFRDAERWRTIGNERIVRFLERNFSPEGFHLEQSPSYHWYTLTKLGEIVAFLRQNGQAVPRSILDRVAKYASVSNYLVRPDGTLPNVGDSAKYPPKRWQKRLESLFGISVDMPKTSPANSPAGYVGEFVVSHKAGYAIFTSYSFAAAEPATDTYALFRCNAWRHSGHCHTDALSFELFGLGREWLVDSGKFNYEGDSPVRKYFVSARAHNVVLIDEEDFSFSPVRLLDSGRNGKGAYVVARHELPQAHHRRRFQFVPPRIIRLTDTIEAVDGKPHTYAQLFHVAPGLRVEIVSPREVRLTSRSGDRCVIRQDGDLGEWTMIEGKRQPFVQGWYSRKFNEMIPNPTLYYRLPSEGLRAEFVTQIRLEPSP